MNSAFLSNLKIIIVKLISVIVIQSCHDVNLAAFIVVHTCSEIFLWLDYKFLL